MLDSYASLAKGGENGAVILAGNADKSELIRRVTLQESHEEFMPAEGKEPLTAEEIKWIAWWIEYGNADPDLRLMQTEPALIACAEPRLRLLPISTAATSKADTGQLSGLRKMGFRVRVLSHDSGALDAVLPEEVANGKPSHLIESLNPVKDQIQWLSLAGTGIQDKDLATIGQFSNLRRLRIENNPITDQGLRSLQSLTNLQVLNLNGTQVTAFGLQALKDLRTLQSIYLWNTGIKSGDKELSQWDSGKLKVVVAD